MLEVRRKMFLGANCLWACGPFCIFIFLVALCSAFSPSFSSSLTIAPCLKKTPTIQRILREARRVALGRREHLIKFGSVSNSIKPEMEINSVGTMSASPVMKACQDVQGTNDATTALDEGMPALGLSGSGSNSRSSFDSIKQDDEDISNDSSRPMSPLVAHAGDDIIIGESKPASPLVHTGVDTNSGFKIASPLVVHAGKSNTGSNMASPTMVVHAGVSKPASPAEVVASATESNKEDGEEKLAGEEINGEEAAGYGGDGVTSKSIKNLSVSDVKDVDKDVPKPMNICYGASGSSGAKGKGKGTVVGPDHAPHIWTERERRKKMKNMYSTLHSLLPRLPDKADKTTIVGEAMDYIKVLEGTIQRLERLKVERTRTQQHGVGSSAAPAPPPAPTAMHQGALAAAPRTTRRQSAMADMVSRNNALQAMVAAPGSAAVPPPLGPFQTWSAPNIVLSMAGSDAFVSMSLQRQPYVLTKALYVLERYRIDVVTSHISSNQNRCLIFIHARINPADTRFPLNLMSVEDRFKLAVSEILQRIGI